jgi:hypothetical protein
MDRLKVVRAMYRDGVASVEQWARVVSIGPRLGPLTTLCLEIHSAGQAPFEVRTLQFLSGDAVEVGKHVAYREVIGDDYTYYEVDLTSPPRYGTTNYVPGTLRPAGAPPAQLLELARSLLARGVITQADFDRAATELRDRDQS